MLMGNTADIEYRGHLARIQRQMVALLPRYCLSDKLLKQVGSIQSSKILLRWQNTLWCYQSWDLFRSDQCSWKHDGFQHAGFLQTGLCETSSGHVINSSANNIEQSKYHYARPLRVRLPIPLRQHEITKTWIVKSNFYLVTSEVKSKNQNMRSRINREKTLWQRKLAFATKQYPKWYCLFCLISSLCCRFIRFKYWFTYDIVITIVFCNTRTIISSINVFAVAAT